MTCINVICRLSSPLPWTRLLLPGFNPKNLGAKLGRRCTVWGAALEDFYNVSHTNYWHLQSRLQVLDNSLITGCSFPLPPILISSHSHLASNVLLHVLMFTSFRAISTSSSISNHHTWHFKPALFVSTVNGNFHHAATFLFTDDRFHF